MPWWLLLQVYTSIISSRVSSKVRSVTLKSIDLPNVRPGLAVVSSKPASIAPHLVQWVKALYLSQTDKQLTSPVAIANAVVSPTSSKVHCREPLGPLSIAWTATDCATTNTCPNIHRAYRLLSCACYTIGYLKSSLNKLTVITWRIPRTLMPVAMISLFRRWSALITNLPQIGSDNQRRANLVATSYIVRYTTVECFKEAPSLTPCRHLRCVTKHRQATAFYVYFALWDLAHLYG